MVRRGEWFNDLFHGYGIRYHPASAWLYEGYFFQNKEVGWIKVSQESGYGFEGNLYNGVMHGETICTLTNGDMQIGSV